jgi:hypothetical protein
MTQADHDAQCGASDSHDCMRRSPKPTPLLVTGRVEELYGKMRRAAAMAIPPAVPLSSTAAAGGAGGGRASSPGGLALAGEQLYIGGDQYLVEGLY